MLRAVLVFAKLLPAGFLAEQAPADLRERVTRDFSACLADDRPSWVGFRDGVGEWDQAEGSSGVFTFPLSAEVGAYAWVPEAEGTPTTQVIHLTRDEFLEVQPVRIRDTPQGTATMDGTVAGVGAGELAGVSLGQAFAIAPGVAAQLE